MNFGVSSTVSNMPQVFTSLNNGINTSYTNNSNGATGSFTNSNIGPPQPFPYMANSANDYYNKNVPMTHRAYENYNNPPMYGQPNGFPLPPPATAGGNSNNASGMSGYMNPNVMKYYNTDMMMNESQKMGNPPLMNHANSVIPMPYMNNFPLENRNHIEKNGIIQPGAVAGTGTGTVTVWVEMIAKNGRKFYYNTVTRSSKWEKPDELKTPEEIKIAQKTKWKEYTCGDGRKYWYHEEKNLSVWEEPEEIKLIRAECAKELNEERTNNTINNAVDPTTTTTNNNNNNNNTTTIKDKTKIGESGNVGGSGENVHPMYPFPMDPMMGGGMYFTDPNNLKERSKKGNKKRGNADAAQSQGSGKNHVVEQFADKHEARVHLKKLFEEKITNPKMTWDNAVKILETYPQWPSFSILTKGEKRQMYSEFASTAVKRVAENERRKRQKSREIIFQTLLNWDKLDEKTTYEDFAKEFYKKEWWEWITERERDEILQDFIDDYKQKFKENRRKRRKLAMEHLKEKFQKYASQKENPLKWEEVKLRFQEDEDFKTLHKLDALATWESFYEKYHLQEKEKLKKKVYRSYRKKRDAFSELLKEYYEKRILNVKTEWVFFVSKIYKDERYIDLLGNPGSTPRMLFEEFIKSLQQKYLKHKVYMKTACKEKKFEIKEDTTFEHFMECFKKYQNKYEIPDIHMNFIFQSMQKKLEDKKKKEEKHIKKVAKFLAKNKELKPTMNYEKVMSIIKCSSKWENLCILCPKEEQKTAAYNMWKMYVNSKQNNLESESESSDYEHRKFKKNRNRKSRSYKNLEKENDKEEEEEEDDEDEEEDEDEDEEEEEKEETKHSDENRSSDKERVKHRNKNYKSEEDEKESRSSHCSHSRQSSYSRSTSLHKRKYSKEFEEYTDSSSHTIESLRTIDNVE